VNRKGPTDRPRAEELSGSTSVYGNLTVRGAEPFADDLSARRGAVSGRVALLLRSAEAKPFAASVCSAMNTHTHTFLSFLIVLQASPPVPVVEGVHMTLEKKEKLRGGQTVAK
jgi:hypothetical protein